MQRRARGTVRIILALLACLGAGSAGPASEGSDEADRARAIKTQKDAVAQLQAAARAGAGGDFAAQGEALRAAADLVEALEKEATWLPASERTTLLQTARSLRERSSEWETRYSPDADLVVLDRIGYRLRGGTSVQLVFEGSFARSETAEEEEEAFGGHATAMGPPPVEQPSQPAPDAGHQVRFEKVRGQLTEETFGGGPSKWHLVESGGNGVALIDYDDDGLLDIYTVTAFDLDERNGRTRIPHRNALYRNLGGLRFQNVASEAGVDLAAWGYGVCAGDYDGDGLLDLYVTNYGPDALFRNQGDGTFQEGSGAAGLSAEGWSTGCAFFDADGDGDLDLYVAGYVTAPWAEVATPERFLVWRGIAKVMLGPAGLPGAEDLFFENQGNGRFAEATHEHGLVDEGRAYGFGVVATDYDGDGWTDIFVANDSNPNFLYHNLGDGRFESVGLLAGVALNADSRAQAGMGADSADFDGDGLLDIADTAFAFDHNSLYRNLDDGTFEDVSRAAGLADTTFNAMTWGLASLDADLDGDLDLYYAHGHLFPQVDEHPELEESYAHKNLFLLNEGGRFRDVSGSAGRGLLEQKCSRAVAVGDLDNDGDPDLVVSAMDDEPTLLENVQESGHHWIGIRLRFEAPNAFAIGARISIEHGGRKQVREVRSGGGYLSQSDLRALFGLGDAAGPVCVNVHLGERHWRFPEVPADRHTILTLDPEAATESR